MKIAIISILVLFSVFASVGANWGHDKTDLINAIKRQEGDVQTITLLSKCTNLARKFREADLSVLNESTVLSTFDTHYPDRKFRIDYRDRKAKWIGGAADFTSAKQIQTWDGQMFQQFLYERGDYNAPHSCAIGEVGSNKDMGIIGTIRDTGLNGTTFGAFNDWFAPRLLSAYVEESTVTKDGNNFVAKLVNGPNMGRTVYTSLTFDEHFMLTSYEINVQNSSGGWNTFVLKTSGTIKVQNPLIASDFVYFPSKIEISAIPAESSKKDVLPTMLTKIELKDVKINDPLVDDSTFKIKFPVGSYVTDQTTGKTFKVGNGQFNENAAIDNTIQQLQKISDTDTQPSR